MKEAYKHDYSGSCAPECNDANRWDTFSVGCFQWIPKTSGQGLKKSAVKFRVKGYVSNPEKVYQKAAEICEKLDNGWIPNTKSITVS